MDSKTINKILAFIGVLLVIGIIYNLFRELNRQTATRVISDKGMEALQDPEKKKKIDKAIEEAKSEHIKTGVWRNPVVDLS